MLGREMKVDDYVVFSNRLYRVTSTSERSRGADVKIMLLNPSKTTTPVRKYSRDMLLVPGEDILAATLKGEIDG